MYTHTRMYINVYEYTYTDIHIYIYIHIHMHLYTHDNCFYYHSWRNNAVIALGTLSAFLA